MDLQAEINWISKELQGIKDPTFIEGIKNMIKYRKKTIDYERISTEQYNKELDESIADIKLGNYKAHEEVKAMMAIWGRK